MASVPPLVAVLTSSSNSGEQAARDLCSKYASKVRVRACFRSEAKASAARSWPSAPTEVCVGVDAADPTSLAKAFEGATFAVIVTPHDAATSLSKPGRDAELVANMINAAVDAGVKHIVFVGSWTTHTPECCPEISSRFVGAEALLKDLEGSKGLKWTVLRSGFFFQNFVMAMSKGIKEGTVRYPALKVPAVDPRDMGRVAAAICGGGDSDSHHGKLHDISGPEVLSADAVVAAISRTLDRPLTYEPIAASSLAAVLPPFFAKFMVWMEEKQESAVPLSAVTKEICGSHTSISEWLEEIGTHQLPRIHTLYFHTAAKAFTSLATGPILMLEHAGLPWDCKEPSHVPSSFPCFAPPMLQQPDGTVSAQSTSVMMALAAETGLLPGSTSDQARAVQVALNASDLHTEAQDNREPEKSKQWMSTRLETWLETIEQTLESAGSGFMVGSVLSWADFAMLPSMETIAELFPDNGISRKARLVAWLAMMQALPKVAAWKSKGVPINAPNP